MILGQLWRSMVCHCVDWYDRCPVSLLQSASSRHLPSASRTSLFLSYVAHTVELLLLVSEVVGAVSCMLWPVSCCMVCQAWLVNTRQVPGIRRRQLYSHSFIHSWTCSSWTCCLHLPAWRQEPSLHLRGLHSPLCSRFELTCHKELETVWPPCSKWERYPVHPWWCKKIDRLRCLLTLKTPWDAKPTVMTIRTNVQIIKYSVYSFDFSVAYILFEIETLKWKIQFTSTVSCAIQSSTQQLFSDVLNGTMACW